MEKKNRKCIIKDRRYNSFYHGGASYTTDLYEAKLYGENEIPEDIKNNPNLKIVSLDSEEGLEIILSEIQKAEHYMSIKSKSLGEVIIGLSKLKSFLIDRVQE